MKFREEKEDHIMSSMKKRILALVLALVMCVGMLPTGVFATKQSRKLLISIAAPCPQAR